jgi:hypothetical protein
MQLKKIFIKGLQIYEAHMEDVVKDKMLSIENHRVLKYFEDVFLEIPGLSPKRDIDFSIDLVSRVAPVSMTPYKMSTKEFKEL